MSLNQSQPTTKTQTQPSPATILLVEDNLPVAELICWLLREAGFETQHAATVGQGLLLAVTRPPSLIVLDVDLPDGNGFDLCRRLKGHPVTGQVPVIFCTGRPDARTEALAAGGVDCVAKPGDVFELPVRILRALDQLSSDPEATSNSNPVNHDE
jgi:DNA-binding response OmpR family regulator